MTSSFLSFLLMFTICSPSILTFLLALSVDSQPMWDIVKSFTSPDLPSSWELGTDPCDQWLNVGCDAGRVKHIQFNDFNLSGILHPSVSKLSALQVLNLRDNPLLCGPLPSLVNLTSLEVIILDNTSFSFIPFDFFAGLTHLQEVFINNVPLAPWTLPPSLSTSSNLTIFSVSNASLTGTIPQDFPSLLHLANLTLSHNNLSGCIDVIGAMPQLVMIDLRSNRLTGPIPDLSNLDSLQLFDVSDNFLTGIVPQSMMSHGMLQNVSLSNNRLQGQFPVFSTGIVLANVSGENRFCKQTLGPCDPTVVALLEVAARFGYPLELANSWTGNNPCIAHGWLGVGCDAKRSSVTELNFTGHNFSGTISQHVANITTLRRIILSNNSLQGSIPETLTTLPLLELLDVTNNNLSGKVPIFSSFVTLKLSGNNFTEFTIPHPRFKKIVIIVATIAVSVTVVLAIGCLAALIIYLCKKRTGSIQPSCEISMAGTRGDKIAGGVHLMIDNVSAPEGMLLSFESLRSATNEFSNSNILGKGGFGVVYKGQLNGISVAVKRSNQDSRGNRGQEEFQAEIDVLTKVRHRNLVALIGYCISRTENLLVYEYMPGGTLAQRLFHIRENGYSPLTSSQRFTIALDVARGLEYLHGLANQTFIHRDLKPSNVLLDNHTRAKISDFGLVKHILDKEKSTMTRVAGTFGYIAPEYADVENHNNLYEMAKLGHLCTMPDPADRPDMTVCANRLTPLVEAWTPKVRENQEEAGPSTAILEVVKRWNAGDSTSISE